MKRISFFLALATLIVSFGLANAGQILIDATTGTWDDNGTLKIIPGGDVTFDLRLINDNGVNAGGITNGFLISSTVDGFTAASGELLDPDFTTYFDLVWSINTYSDGNSPDTVGFGGSKMTGSGLPDGYDGVAYRLHTGGFPEYESIDPQTGDTTFATVCLDSSFYGTTGSWLWAPGGAPLWLGLDGSPVPDGGFCMISAVPPCLPPSVTNAPPSLTGSHCDVMSYDFDAALDPGDDPNNSITFSANIGNIDANTGAWSYAPTLADVGASIVLTVTVSNGTCDAGTDVNLNFTNEAPSISTCGDITVSTSVPTEFQMAATDDCDPFSWSIGPNTTVTSAIIDGNGLLTVTADDAGTFTVEVVADDGNASGSCVINVQSVPGSLVQVRIPCVGGQEPGEFVLLGQHANVPVLLDASDEDLGGYDLLIAYDNSVLSFQAAYIGADYGPDGLGWEYFTYRYGADGNCGNSCPSGLLRVTAIADINNGPNHPDPGNGPLGAALFNLDFLVTNDHSYECQEVAIRFFWMDCGDNGLSTSDGELLIADAVFDGYDPTNEWGNNKMNIIDWNSGYPTYQGPDSSDCFSDPHKQPTSKVSFEDGCLWIACDDALDARGDLNLNNVANEVADAVLFSNYFIYGLSVFTINEAGQIAASDVNNDGLTLSVADLVYLIRIVVGDALPIPKLSPLATTVSVDDGEVNVKADMGAAYVVVEGNVAPTLLVDNMEMKYSFDAESRTTRVLIYSMDQGETFSGHFLNANGTVTGVEFATYDGAPVSAKIIPGKYSLAQNYPNPFNPSTSVSFNIPVKSEYSLVIYNVTGQKVSEFIGSADAGKVTIEWDASAQASGIYFYKLTAGDFTDTKKMVLLK